MAVIRRMPIIVSSSTLTAGISLSMAGDSFFVIHIRNRYLAAVGRLL
jgi:hypothetical protein